MRISDWSSDVCSSDLGGRAGRRRLDTAYRCRECGEPGVGLLLRRCQRVTDRALPVVLLAECQQLGVGVRMGKRRPGQQDGGSGAKYGYPVHVPLPQIGLQAPTTRPSTIAFTSAFGMISGLPAAYFGLSSIRRTPPSTSSWQRRMIVSPPCMRT